MKSYKNFQSLEILKEKATREGIHLKNYLAKKLCSLGSNV
jgi:hypothetical protein